MERDRVWVVFSMFENPSSATSKFAIGLNGESFLFHYRLFGKETKLFVDNKRLKFLLMICKVQKETIGDFKKALKRVLIKKGMITTKESEKGTPS